MTRTWTARPRPRFRSPVHDERVAALLGASLGVCFALCFATGLVSHLVQDPPSWFRWPSRPAGLYRVLQGVHVTTGIASIPLLFAKLWSVYPKLFEWPPVRGVLHAVERLALLPLVGGAVFLLVTGVGNVNVSRPWRFPFRPGHHAAAWITMGALAVHVGAKWATTRRVLWRAGAERPGDASGVPRRHPAPRVEPTLAEVAHAHGGVLDHDGALDRRGFLVAAFGTAGLLAATTVGQTFTPLTRLALLAPRRPDVGPQGFPVNRTAASAGVLESAFDPAYRLVVDGPRAARRLELSLDDLRAMEQHEATLPIACVEDWSASRRWRGVPVRDLLALAGAPDGCSARVVSFQRGGRDATSELNPWHAHDPDTLLALEVGGEPLHVDHGYPLRLIGPNRPGVMQTKWVGRLEAR